MNAKEIKEIIKNTKNVENIRDVEVLQTKEAHTTSSVYTTFVAKAYAVTGFDCNVIEEIDGHKFAKKIWEETTISGQVRESDHDSFKYSAGIDYEILIENPEDNSKLNSWKANIGFENKDRAEACGNHSKVVSAERVTSDITKVTYEDEVVYYFNY